MKLDSVNVAENQTYKNKKYMKSSNSYSEITYL